MKWAEHVHVKSNQSTMYEVGADVNATVLMIEAAAAEVLGVTSGGGTEHPLRTSMNNYVGKAFGGELQKAV